VTFSVDLTPFALLSVLSTTNLTATENNFSPLREGSVELEKSMETLALKLRVC
jgi:hypothetical protein